MGRRWTIAMVIALMAVGLLNGCELGWDFLKESGGGGSAGAQADCQTSLPVARSAPTTLPLNSLALSHQKLSAFALAETGCG